MAPDPETLERRCPRLGGTVTFAYCTGCGDGDPPLCFKILDCWWERFDVAGYLKTRVSPEAVDRLASPAAAPPDKVTTIVDLIRQARDRQARQTED
jgi:hypothetical protein